MIKDSETFNLQNMTKDEQIAYLKNIISLLPGNIYWKDTHGRYLGCNNNVAKILGLENSDAIIGKTDQQLLKKKYVPETIAVDNQVINSNKELIVEENGYDMQGNPRIYLSRKAPLYDVHGKIIGILGTSIDITDQKQTEIKLAEEKKAAEVSDQFKSNVLNNIVSLLPGNVYWKDRQGVYLGCNLNLLKMLNLKSTSDVIGKTDEDLISPSQARMVREVDNRVFHSKQEETFEEVDYDAKEGPITYLSTKAPLWDENGNIIGLMGVSIDISDRKKIERDLIIAKENAEAANKAKTEFIHNMSHDIRTPFSGILGFSQMLYSEETDIYKKEILGYIVESSQRLLKLLNEIIDLVSLKSGAMVVKSAPLKIHDVINDCINIMMVDAKFKNLSLNLTITDQVPELIISDKMRLHRILLNLVSNALKFTHKGTVSILADSKSENGNLLLILQVADTGIGIPPDQYAHIFDRFTRLTSSYKGIYQGTGLGLYIVKQFVDDLQGNIHVESHVGQGTTFTCQIPIEKIT